MLTLKAPQRLDGIGRALAEYAGLPFESVALVGDQLRISGDTSRTEAQLQAFADSFTPSPPPPGDALADRVARLEARLDRAASATVTAGTDAAKLRDAVKPTQ